MSTTISYNDTGHEGSRDGLTTPEPDLDDCPYLWVIVLILWWLYVIRNIFDEFREDPTNDLEYDDDLHGSSHDDNSPSGGVQQQEPQQQAPSDESATGSDDSRQRRRRRDRSSIHHSSLTPPSSSAALESAEANSSSLVCEVSRDLLDQLPDGRIEPEVQETEVQGPTANEPEVQEMESEIQEMESEVQETESFSLFNVTRARPKKIKFGRKKIRDRKIPRFKAGKSRILKVLDQSSSEQEDDQIVEMGCESPDQRLQSTMDRVTSDSRSLPYPKHYPMYRDATRYKTPLSLRQRKLTELSRAYGTFKKNSFRSRNPLRPSQKSLDLSSTDQDDESEVGLVDDLQVVAEKEPGSI